MNKKNDHNPFAVAVFVRNQKIGYVPADLISEVESYHAFNVSELSIYDGEIVGCTLVGIRRAGL